MLLLFLYRTLKMIAEYAEAQVDRARFIRVMNSVGDGKNFANLAQAINRFEVGYFFLVTDPPSNRFPHISNRMKSSD